MLLQTEGELHIAAGTTFSVSVVPLMEDDVERAEKSSSFSAASLQALWNMKVAHGAQEQRAWQWRINVQSWGLRTAGKLEHTFSIFRSVIRRQNCVYVSSPSLSGRQMVWANSLRRSGSAFSSQGMSLGLETRDCMGSIFLPFLGLAAGTSDCVITWTKLAVTWPFASPQICQSSSRSDCSSDSYMPSEVFWLFPCLNLQWFDVKFGKGKREAARTV